MRSMPATAPGSIQWENRYYPSDEEYVFALAEALREEYRAIVEGLRRIETLLTDERGRREILERGLAELKERVALLQARIDELERRLQS